MIGLKTAFTVANLPFSQLKVIAVRVIITRAVSLPVPQDSTVFGSGGSPGDSPGADIFYL